MKDRVQIQNTINNRWIKVNTKTGRVIGHKNDKKPYKNIIQI